MTTNIALDARPAFLDGTAKQLLIDGKWVDAASGRTFATLNPTTGEPLDHVALGGAEDIDRAVKAARHALEGPWGKFTPAERSRVILRLAELVEANGDELMLLDITDMGSPASMMRRILDRVIGNLRYAAAQAVALDGGSVSSTHADGIMTYTLKEPIGVVGAIIPWNGPLMQASWKIGPALATGCAIVLKPAEQASMTPLLLGKLALEAGIPPGVLNVVTGEAEAGAALAAHPDVNKVSFTGSTETGQHIIRASAGNIKRLTLELGGKSPDIVFADADLDAAVPVVAMAAFVNSGQACSAGTRLFVERSIQEEFTARVAEFARSLKVGHPLDPSVALGPLVDAEQLKRVNSYLSAGAGEGATTLSGGAQLTDGDLAKGFFVAPTTFGNVTDEMTIAREEIFGPVLSVLSFDDVDEVIRRANATNFGLAAGVWSRDLSKVNQLSRALQAGNVYVNTYARQDSSIPFGGYKMSGYGRENGREHYEAYLQTKAVYLKYS